MTKKKIFVSHASEDKELVQSFVDNILEGYLGIKSEDILFTSSNNLAHKLEKDDKDYVEKLLQFVRECELFIIIETLSFIESQACQNELGAAFVFNPTLDENIITKIVADTSSSILLKKRIVTFADDFASGNTNQFYLYQKLKYTFAEKSLKDFADKLASYELLCLGKKADNFKEFAKKVEEAYEQHKQKSYSIIKTAKIIINALTETDTFHGFHPIVVFGKRQYYNDLAVEVSKNAKLKLLWTIHKSPLLVESAYYETNFLTEYDKQFASFETKEKIRLVIFESKEAAKAYKECNQEYHNARINSELTFYPISPNMLENRKKAFEENILNNRGTLFFSTIEKIRGKLKENPKIGRILENPSLKDFEPDYELGFIYNDNVDERKNFGFATGFNSQSSNNEYSEGMIKHIVFYSHSPLVMQSDQITTEPRYKIMIDVLCQIEIAQNIIVNRNWKNILFDNDNFDKLLL
jgi:hypothetical protein